MFAWLLRDRLLHFDRRALVMGIVNATPDSFSDGGRLPSTDAAIAHGLRLVDEGADLLDIGGESSRPGAVPVPLDEELRRVLPVIEGLAPRTTVPLSVDTSKAEVARQCLAAGAHIINDITALQGDAAMPHVVQSARAGVVLMHMQGTPQTMQRDPRYDEVVGDIRRFFEARLQALAEQSIAEEQVVLDPGIGFGKTAEHNLVIVARLGEFASLGRPVCLGVSRKGFMGKLLSRDLPDRLAGSLAVAAWAVSTGSAQIVRVHDVKETRDVVHLISHVRAHQRPVA